MSDIPTLPRTPIIPSIVLPLEEAGDVSDANLDHTTLTGTIAGAAPPEQAELSLQTRQLIDQYLEDVMQDIRSTMQIMDVARREVARRLGLPNLEHLAVTLTGGDGSAIALMAVGSSSNGAPTRSNGHVGEGLLQVDLGSSSVMVMPQFLFDGTFVPEMDDEEFVRLRRRNRTLLDDAVLRALLS